MAKGRQEMGKALTVATFLAAAFLLLFVVVPGRGSMIEASGPDKALVCHREGNGSFHSINVAAAALAAHLDHGDAAYR